MNRLAVRALDDDQDKLFDRAVRSADAAELVVRKVWEELLAVIQAGGHPTVVQVRARRVLDGFAARLLSGLANDLADVANTSHEITVDTVASKLSPRAVDRLRSHRGELFESLPDEAATKLFPSPSLERVQGIIFQNDWANRLSSLTRLASPELLAGQIASQFASGATLQEIAKAIRPAVQGVQSSARRVARTEGMRVAHEVQMDAYEQMGPDLVIGYQIHATKDQHTRKWHYRRDGTIYYRNPKKGQKGFYQMPRPPMEAPDPAERPPGTPQVAPNCRCYLTPVLDV